MKSKNNEIIDLTMEDDGDAKDKAVTRGDTNEIIDLTMDGDDDANDQHNVSHENTPIRSLPLVSSRPDVIGHGQQRRVAQPSSSAPSSSISTPSKRRPSLIEMLDEIAYGTSPIRSGSNSASARVAQVKSPKSTQRSENRKKASSAVDSAAKTHIMLSIFEAGVAAVDRKKICDQVGSIIGTVTDRHRVIRLT